MKNPFENEPLEVRLIKLPFTKMIDALEAFDDLDGLLLEQLEREGPAKKLAEWREKVVVRKQDRRRLVEFRLALEARNWPMQ